MVGQGPEAALNRAAAAAAAAATAADATATATAATTCTSTSPSTIIAPSAVVSELERLAIMQTQSQVGEISS